MKSIHKGYPVEEQEGWEVDMNSLTDEMTEFNFGGAGVDADGMAQSCQTGLHSIFIFAITKASSTRRSRKVYD